MFPGQVPVERISGCLKININRQNHRQVFFAHRHRTTTLTMNHGDRAAPISLPGDKPVAQSVIRGAFALIHVLQAIDDLTFGSVNMKTI